MKSCQRSQERKILLSNLEFQASSTQLTFECPSSSFLWASYVMLISPRALSSHLSQFMEITFLTKRSPAFKPLLTDLRSCRQETEQRLLLIILPPFKGQLSLTTCAPAGPFPWSVPSTTLLQTVSLAIPTHFTTWAATTNTRPLS